MLPATEDDFLRSAASAVGVGSLESAIKAHRGSGFAFGTGGFEK